MERDHEMRCSCNVLLPHSAEELRKKQESVYLPRYVLAPDPKYEVQGIWESETADLVNDLSAVVQDNRNRTAELRHRVGCLEDRVEHAERTGIVHHDQRCVYSKRFAGTKEPQIPESLSEDKIAIRSLEKKLKSANAALVQNRNQILALKDELKQCKTLVARELGADSSIDNVDELLRSGTQGGWKGRTQIIKALRARIVVLESQLVQLRKLFRHDVDSDVYDPSFNADDEYDVPRAQRYAINKMYYHKTDVIQNKNLEIAQWRDQYQELLEIYKATMARNSVLCSQVKNYKQKIKILEDKSKENQLLIESLMKHKNLVKDMVKREKRVKNKEQLREKDLEEIMAAASPNMIRKQIDTECAKYKTLLDVSEATARNLGDMVTELHNRLDVVTYQVIESEKHCAEHNLRIHELQKQLDTMRRTGKVYRRAKITDKKRFEHLIDDEILKTKREENDMLRSFIRDAVLTKAQDFELYRMNLEAAKQSYLASIEQIKKDILNDKTGEVKTEAENENEEVEEAEDDAEQ